MSSPADVHNSKMNTDKTADALKMNKKCLYIVRNLLRCLEEDDNGALGAPTYLREWMQTERCDEVLKTADFEEIRKSIEITTTPDVMRRIKSFTETEKDMNVALQTVTHYREWHRDVLMSNLPFSERVYHHTILKAERTLAVLGIVGLTHQGFRGVRGMSLALKKKWKGS
jgi:hypothetical protein